MQTIRSHEIIGSVKTNLQNAAIALAESRLKKLSLWRELKKEGCDKYLIEQTLYVSEATLYRWDNLYDIYGLEGLENGDRRPDKVRRPVIQNAIYDAVLAIRKEYPVYGKEKIRVLLEDHNIYVSASSVGRVLNHLMEQGKIQPVAEVCGKKMARKARIFNNHAQKYTYRKSQKPGDMMQIDHMTIDRFKVFSAICPATKILFSKSFHQATSHNGALFLKEALQAFPFQVSSIQVDGGSEFMSHFEDLCQELKIDLFVLPPRSPKLNGNVERSNGTLYYEFFQLQHNKIFKLDDMNERLRRYVQFYNYKRPHQGLQYLTPMRYFTYREEK